MADYIKRESVINAIESLPTWWADDGGFYGGAKPPMVALLDPEDTISAIENIPSADVQPVVHGKWIKARGSWCTPGGDPVWECSECGKGMHVYGVEHGTYGSDVADGQWVACPNCGARMDGEA